MDFSIKNSVFHQFSDYVSFMKRAMTLLQKDYTEIVELVIDYKIVEESDQVTIPDATQYGKKLIKLKIWRNFKKKNRKKFFFSNFSKKIFFRNFETRKR